MRNLFVLFLIIIGFFSCDYTPYPTYRLYTMSEVPDSLKPEYRQWVIDCISSASYHVSGGDYEDPEDVVEECRHSGWVLFSEEIEGLKIRYAQHDYVIVYYEDLSDGQKKIFDFLKLNGEWDEINSNLALSILNDTAKVR